MELCDEYVSRMGLNPVFPMRVRKGFVFFGEDNRLLVVKWVQDGPTPGSYEFSECILENKVRSVRTEEVSWEEYDSYVLEWLDSHKTLVFDKSVVLNLAWEFFLRRNDSLFSELYDPAEIYETVNPLSSSRCLAIADFLEKVLRDRPEVYKSWSSKIGDVVSCYMHWLKGMAANPSFVYNSAKGDVP